VSVGGSLDGNGVPVGCAFDKSELSAVLDAVNGGGTGDGSVASPDDAN